MFDFAWSEIALVGVVALLVIGPKDLPVAMKGAAKLVRRARQLGSEFQSHVDDMLREVDPDGVREQFRGMRGMDVRGRILKTIDEDGSLRRALDEPAVLSQPPMSGGPAPAHEGASTLLPASDSWNTPLPERSLAAPGGTLEIHDPDLEADLARAPAFLPPAAARRVASARRYMMRTPSFLPPPRVFYGDHRVDPLAGLPRDEHA